MEFVEGETLQNLIKRSGRLEVKLALKIATQVAAGLAAVHKKKLVHRDIKPSNIMVSFEEEGAVTAKIIDLGLAKAVDEAGAQTTISGSGAFAAGVRQSGTNCRRRGRYPFGSLLAWCFALADADRSCAISGYCRPSYVSTSARSLAG
jgi:serine/threonine protein kinase